MNKEFGEKMEGGEDVGHFREIQRVFRGISSVDEETVRREIIDKYSKEEILDAVDDSNCADARPDVLFLILQILDPKSLSMSMVAEILVDSPDADEAVKTMALEYLDEQK